MSTDGTPEPRRISAAEALGEERAAELGLGTPPPPPQTFEQMAEAVGEDPEELALMRGVRNQDDYKEAQAKIAALRELREEERRKALRESVRKW